jgi:tRNA pseudouridine55 synthase
VDKPAGPTSHDVVAVARRALRTRRIGHTGTLDPFASGLLLLCVGPATRLAEYLTHLPKSYTAVLRLGEATDTLDRTGTVVARSDSWRRLTRAEVADALEGQLGRRLQVPPDYSAKKVGGERLYQRARRGETALAQAVEVEITSIRLVGWEAPDAEFEVTCSSGTYIRAIARDVGLGLGTYGHLVALRRTAIGPRSLAGAIPLEQLQQPGFVPALLSPRAALAHLPMLEVDDAAARAVRVGRVIAVPATLVGDAVLVLWHDRLLAVGEAHGGRLQPRKVLGDA